MTENQNWAWSVEMYSKWARLNTDGAKRMMERHRSRFPTMSKVFDQIDAETRVSNNEN